MEHISESLLESILPTGASYKNDDPDEYEWLELEEAEEYQAPCEDGGDSDAQV